MKMSRRGFTVAHILVDHREIVMRLETSHGRVDAVDMAGFGFL
jgi:hypothetical protein